MVGVDCRAVSDRGLAVMVNASESVGWRGGVARMTAEEATTDQPGSTLGTAEQRTWDRLERRARGSSAHQNVEVEPCDGWKHGQDPATPLMVTA